MKRLALVLTVAAIAAVSCTTPGAVPVTTSSSSTTQAGASAREAIIAYDPQLGGILIDSSSYPSGATISAEIVGAPPCVWLIDDTDAGRPEIDGSRSCAEVSIPSRVFTRSNPVPLKQGEVLYEPKKSASTAIGLYPVGNIFVLRIRW